MLNLRSIALAAMLAALSLPSASVRADMVNIGGETSASGPLGRTWTGSWLEGWNIAEYVSDVSIGAHTLSYDYLAYRYWAGVPTQTYKFATTAAKDETLTLNIGLLSNAEWDGSNTAMYLWQGDVANRQLLAGATADQTVSTSLTLNLAAGEEWGFLAISGSVGDVFGNGGPLYGSFTVRDAATGGEVPEPASLALLGLGALGVAAARRKTR